MTQGITHATVGPFGYTEEAMINILGFRGAFDPEALTMIAVAFGFAALSFTFLALTDVWKNSCPSSNRHSAIRRGHHARTQPYPLWWVGTLFTTLCGIVCAMLAGASLMMAYLIS